MVAHPAKMAFLLRVLAPWVIHVGQKTIIGIRPLIFVVPGEAVASVIGFTDRFTCSTACTFIVSKPCPTRDVRD